MKKIMLLAIVIFYITFAGCKNNTNNNTMKEPVKTNTINSAKTNSNTSNIKPVKTDTKDNPKTSSTVNNVSTSSNKIKKPVQENKKKVQPQSKKQEYINKLALIDKQISIDERLTKDGAQYAINQFEYHSFDKWDSALNEIYNVLKQQLSASNMKKLKNDEITWIAVKNNTAEKQADEMRGGSGEDMLRYASLAESTKDRCYKLVNVYMK